MPDHQDRSVADGSSGVSEGVSHGFDPEALRAVYPALQSMQIDFSERKWETVRAASFLALGLLAAVGGIAAQARFQRWYVLAVLAVTLLAVGFLLGRWVRSNVIRESKLQFHVEFSMYQIEKLLGLHEPIPPPWRWHPKAEYVFGRKHLEYSFNADAPRERPEGDDYEGEWVDARAARSGFVKTTVGFSLIVFVAS
jgi:hypothetical protein